MATAIAASSVSGTSRHGGNGTLSAPEPGTTYDLFTRAQRAQTRYTKGELVGRGACKTVYRAFDEEEGIEVAWNEVTVSGEFASVQEKERERIFGEIRLLQQLKHKNILALHDWWFDRKNSNIVFITELFMDGSLRSYRRKHKNVDSSVLKRWAWQILQGLVYLHGHNPPIIHRDLKSDNILMNGASGILKIGDLGFATFRVGFSGAMSVIGTPEFMAPELYEEKYDEKVDIYSFGMCLLELATLEYPYSECRNAAQIFKKVTAGLAPQGLSRIADEELRDFVLLCIRQDPAQRPEARQLLKHPFFEAVRAECCRRPAPLQPGVSVPMGLVPATMSSLPSPQGAKTPSDGLGGAALAVAAASSTGGMATPPPAMVEAVQPVVATLTAAAAALRLAQDSLSGGADGRPTSGSMAETETTQVMAPELLGVFAGAGPGPGLGIAAAAALVQQQQSPGHFAVARTPAANGGSGLVTHTAPTPIPMRPGTNGPTSRSATSNLPTLPPPSTSGLADMGDDVFIYMGGPGGARDSETGGAGNVMSGAGPNRQSTAYSNAGMSNSALESNRESMGSGVSAQLAKLVGGPGWSPTNQLALQRSKDCEALMDDDTDDDFHTERDNDVLTASEIEARVRLNCRTHEDNMLAFSMSFVNHLGTRKKVGFQYDMANDTATEVAGEMIENLSLNNAEAGFIASLIQREIARFGRLPSPTDCPPLTQSGRLQPASTLTAQLHQQSQPALPSALSQLPLRTSQSGVSSTSPPTHQQQGWLETAATAPVPVPIMVGTPPKSALTQGLALSAGKESAPSRSAATSGSDGNLVAEMQAPVVALHPAAIEQAAAVPAVVANGFLSSPWSQPAVQTHQPHQPHQRLQTHTEWPQQQGGQLDSPVFDDPGDGVDMDMDEEEQDEEDGEEPACFF